MNKKITFLTILIILISTALNATVWRVNNRPNVDADFTTLQDAINGASSGDTLYIGGSATTYGDGTFDKQLVVIGAGYWLAENDTTQAYSQDSQVAKLIFNTGSEGSFIQGLKIYYNDNEYSLIEINADNIILKKNYIYANESASGTTHFAIKITGDRSSITINQNWINAKNRYWGTVYGLYFTGIPTNCIISNNFIRSFNEINGSYNAITMATFNLSNDLVINNNVIWGTITTYHTFLVNNILVSGTYNNNVEDQSSNNLCNGTQFPDINNNQQNIDMSTVFIDYVGYIDNDYILKAASPAIGAGVNGGDCGVFSYDYGTNPYVLSGMPEIPAIFGASAGATVGTTSLPINIKASSHNEYK